jgi:hypothetical protein
LRIGTTDDAHAADGYQKHKMPLFALARPDAPDAHTPKRSMRVGEWASGSGVQSLICPELLLDYE